MNTIDFNWQFGLVQQMPIISIQKCEIISEETNASKILPLRHNGHHFDNLFLNNLYDNFYIQLFHNTLIKILHYKSQTRDAYLRLQNWGI